MKLFLCSHFSSVGSLIKEEIENKKVTFIPTASLREGYTGYVGSARKLFKKLGAIVTEIEDVYKRQLLASNACGLVSRFWLHCWVPDASKHSTALSASR